MKRLLMILLLAMLILSGCAAKEEDIVFTVVFEDAQPAGSAYRKLTPEQAKEMIDGGNVVIPDVRTDEELAAANQYVSWLPRYSIDDTTKWLKQVDWDQAIAKDTPRDNYIWGFRAFRFRRADLGRGP